MPGWLGRLSTTPLNQWLPDQVILEVTILAAGKKTFDANIGSTTNFVFITKSRVVSQYNGYLCVNLRISHDWLKED